MRRSVLLLTPLLPLALWACEDGPNQTFAPATGSLFNNGDTAALTDDAGAPLTGNYGGSSKTEICSGAELQQQWGAMIKEPIRPPYHMAGLDLSGGPAFPIMKIEEAEYGPLTPINPDGTPNPNDKLTRLCQPTVDGPGGNGGDVGGSLLVHWGNNSEVQLEWAIPTHKAYIVTLNQGYVGPMQWSYTPKTEIDGSPGKTHSYVFQIGSRVQKDGNDFNFDWAGGPGAWACGAGSKCRKEVDEFYKGIVSQFTPDLYTDTPTDCATNGTCGIFPPQSVDGVHPIIGFRPAAFYMVFQDPGKNAANLAYYAYVFAIKFPPYGLAVTQLKMDNQGPFAQTQIGKEVGTQQKCVLQLGNSFKQLEDNCIQVFDAQTNTSALAKVLGGISHDDQNFAFNVVAVNQNYFPKSLSLGGSRQFDVIHDGETPADNPSDNIAGDFTFDVRASGPILNDGFATPAAGGAKAYHKDWHGSGAIWREWGRISHERLAADYAALHPNKPADAVYWPRAWHDSQCYFPVGVNANASPGLDNGCDNLTDDPSTATVNECSDVTGCTWNATDKTCGGAATIVCSALTKDKCGEAGPAGCVWDGTTCQSGCIHLTTAVSCKQATAHGLGCSWNATDKTCVGQLVAPASCAELPYGLASTVGCGWNVPKPNTCGTQVPSSCTGGGACTGLTQVDCNANAACLWDTNGNGTACQGHADEPSCTADTAHHCAYWIDSRHWRAPDGCTGLEAMMDDSTADDYDGSGGGYSGPSDLFALGGAGLGGFKPGNPVFYACNDPGVGNFCGDSGDIAGLDSDLLGGALIRAIQYLGKGDLNDVPLEGRDLRFFFKTFTIAYAKYMTNDKAAMAPGVNDAFVGTGAPAVPDFHTQFVDTDYLIFDSFGGGAARSEYVDYTHAGEKDADGNVEDPTDIEIKMLLIGSNLQSESFYRRLDREERALFLSMALDDKQTAWAYLKDGTGTPIPSAWTIPGSTAKFPRVNANVFLTNIVGAPNVGGLFSAAGDGTVAAPAGWVNDCKLNDTAPVKDAYFCATHAGADAAGCPLHAPTDDAGNVITRENGKPLLADYCGMFYPTAFAIGSSDGLELDGDPDLLTETQKVKFTHYADPFDPSSTRTQIEALVPYKSKKEGVGYPVVNPASPMQDVFVETDQFEMTGQVVTPIVDYVETSSTEDGGATHRLAQIQAIETEDYLGEVFLCVDQTTQAARAGTHRPGDVLSAHMYTSVQIILDWIASHPGAQDTCGLVIRYSPFNNYPDVIQATAAGVRLGIEQSAGFGRVSDVTVFQPGTGVPAAP